MTSDYITSDSPLAAFFHAAPAPVAAAVTAAAVVAMTTPVDFTTLALPLLAHQEEAVRFMLAQRQAYIGDEMGLGKTFSAIAAVALSGSYPCLVVCPPTLTLNWRNEIRRLVPGARVEVLTGMKPALPAPADWYVIGDAVLAKWTGRNVKDASTGRSRFTPDGVLGSMTFGALVIDEAHRFKSWTAQRTRAALALGNLLPAGCLRVLMSGTAVLNCTAELAPQLAIGGTAGVFHGVGAFLDRYAPKVDRWGTRASRHTAELHETMARTFYLRRLRSEVLTLPGKGRTRVATAMTGKAAADYLRCQDDLIAYLRGEHGKAAADAAQRAEALVRLTNLRRLVGAAKVDSVIDYVRDLVDDGEQVFVAAWHADVIDALCDAFPGCVRVTGAESTPRKQAAVEAFQAGTARVLVGNIIAAGVGITLTAAAHVVIAELPWHSGMLAQVEDRLDRIGQTREVVSHIMLASNGIPSVDDRIMALLEDKARVTGMVLDGEEGAIFDGEESDDGIMAALLDSYR